LALAAEPFVVGIGASAGGIEALEGLFRHTPADAGLAFVVVTHLDPTRESMLPEVVSRFTTLAGRPGEDGAGARARPASTWRARARSWRSRAGGCGSARHCPGRSSHDRPRSTPS
jgi:hypothetical protein